MKTIPEIKDQRGCIYEYTHRENGKKYIGMTIDPIERNKVHKKAKDDTHFHRAIKNYGFDAFDYHIIEWCHKQFLKEREIYWIDHYNTFKGDGYNQTPGGDGFASGEDHPNYGKTGKNNPMHGRTGKDHPRYGQTHTEEVKESISKKMSGENNPMHGRIGKDNPFYGELHTFETKETMSQKRKDYHQKNRIERDKKSGQKYIFPDLYKQRNENDIYTQ